jgi:hypothetical protein
MEKTIDFPDTGLKCAFWNALKYICEEYNGGWLVMSRDDWNYDEFVCVETNMGKDDCNLICDGDIGWSSFLSYLNGEGCKAVPWNPTNDDIFNHSWYIHS